MTTGHLLAALLAGATAADVITTRKLLRRGGRELNPVLRLWMQLGGGWWIAIKAIPTVVLGWYVATQPTLAHLLLAGGLALFLGGVAVWNWRQLRRGA